MRRRLYRSKPFVCLVIAYLAASATAAATELRVAVAANFLGTAQQLAPDYERASGDQLIFSAAASGQLYAQIVAGAPFDVFLSADIERPAALEKSGLALSGSRFTYAVGQLALWSATPGLFTDGAAWLRAGRFRFVALANPESAPYGLAAQHLLQRLRLWDSLQSEKKLVLGSSLSQTFQFASSGSADAAFVAWPQIRHADGRIAGSYWLPPITLAAPIEQQALALKASHAPAAALAFLRWLRTDAQAANRLRAAGYRLP